MKKEIDTGGWVYPRVVAAANNGMTIRQYYMIHGPEPSIEAVNFEGERDRLANPHCDSYKQPRRSRAEIVADLRWAYADALIAREGI